MGHGRRSHYSCMLLARYESLEHSSINLEHVKHWKDSSDLIVRIVWLEDIQGAKNKLIGVWGVSYCMFPERKVAW